MFACRKGIFGALDSKRVKINGQIIIKCFIQQFKFCK